MSVQEGDVAPDFKMPASGGRTVSMQSLKGNALRCHSTKLVDADWGIAIPFGLPVDPDV